MAGAKSINWTTVAIIGMGLYYIDSLVKKGEESDEDTQDVEDLKATQNPWYYSVFKVPPKKSNAYRITLKPSEIVKAGARIDDGIGILTDDEAMIMSGVRLAGTKTDIKVIADYMSRHYSYDVYEKLKKKLSRRELNRVNAYVIKLPNYRSSGYIRGCR